MKSHQPESPISLRQKNLVRRWGVPLLLVAATLTALLPGLGKPFIGHHDWNGVQYGNMARNYLRYGLLQTKLGQIENAGVVSKADFAVNTHYPPVLPLLVAASFLVFGVQEWAARLVPMIASGFAVFLVFRIARSSLGNGPGVIAGILLTVTPMFRYFAKMPVHEPLITAAVLWVTERYLAWRAGQGSWRWLLVATILAQSIGWPGYYIAPLLFLFDWFRRKSPDLRVFLPLLVTAPLQFSLHLLHNLILVGEPFGGGLLRVLRLRLDLADPSQNVLFATPLSDFLSRELVWSVVYFTAVQLVLMILGAFLLIKEGRLRQSQGVYLVLLAYGVVHAAIFRHAALLHEYLLFYLGPGIALCAAFALERIRLWIGERRRSWRGGMAWGVVIAAVWFSFLERRSFAAALESTRMHEIGKLVGEEIAAQTAPTETIWAHSLPFAMIYSKFVLYYADRTVLFFDKESQPLPEGADYEMIIKDRQPSGFNPVGYRELDDIYIRDI